MNTLPKAGPEHHHEQQHEEDVGEGEEDVGDAHDHRVDGPPVVARQRTERQPEGERDADGDHADQQRDARGHERAREHVATDVVGAEGMSQRGRRLGDAVVDRVGVVGRQIAAVDAGDAGEDLGHADDA